MKNLWLLLAVCFVVVGSFLRVWQLGVVPDGLTWDEAAIGYNGWSVWTTRRDEWLERLPISFKSFGDFKAPLAIYINGPFTLLLGMHAWSIRLPFALAGSLLLGIWLFFLLTLKKWKLLTSGYAVAFGVASLAFSPWHLMFSRIGFESGLSLLLLVSGMFAVLWYLKKSAKLWLLLLGAFFLAMSLYAYHSAKIVVPLLLLATFYFWRNVWIKKLQHVGLATAFGLVLVAPLLYDTFIGEGGSRAGGLIPMTGEPLGVQLTMIADSIAANIRPLFLLTGEGDEPRHVAGTYGPLTVSVLAFLLTGVLILGKAINIKSAGEKLQLGLFSGVWALIGFIPSYLSVEAPHANRAVLALPGILLLAVLAFDWVVEYIQSSKGALKLFCITGLSFLLLGEVMLTTDFLQDYFTNYSARATDSFQTGYVEAMQLADKARRKEEPFQNVEQILFDSQYGQPVIFGLANVDGKTPVNNEKYHHGHFYQYLFVDTIRTGDLSRPNTLLIWTPMAELRVPEANVITDRAGQLRYYWYVTPGRATE